MKSVVLYGKITTNKCKRTDRFRKIKVVLILTILYYMFPLSRLENK